MNSLGVVGYLFGRVNKKLGPFLLRNGIKLRYFLGGGVVKENHFLDGLLLINWSQRIVSSEVYDDSKKAKETAKTAPTANSTKTDDTEKNSKGEAQLRIKILESYLRPILLKNEKWSDVNVWRFNNRLLKWAREEFLKAKYGPQLRDAFIGYPKLSKLPQVTKRKNVLGFMFEDTTNSSSPTGANTNATYLPTTSILQNAFDMDRWTSKKDTTALNENMKQITSTKLGGELYQIRDGAMVFADVPTNTDLSGLSLEQILEVVGGRVQFCGPFNALCEEANIYQLWTKEYINRLAKYLLKRTNEFPGETVVVDIGAGDGLLAKYLHSSMGENLLSDAKKRLGSSKRNNNNNNRRLAHQGKTLKSLQKTVKVPNIVAVDDGSWKISEKAIVLRLSVEEALAEYCALDDDDDDQTNIDKKKPQKQKQKQKQTIILCSWMPMNIDWSSLFRKFNVNEYILIGECDDGTCGGNWETWGNPAFQSDTVTADDLMKASSSSSNSSSSAPAVPTDHPEDSQVDEDTTAERPMPPYEIDGYKRTDMDALAKFQFSRFDSSISKTGRTISFRLSTSRK